VNLERAVVLSCEEIYKNTRLLWLSAPGVARTAQPGQFLMIRCGEGWDPLLPRPMSFHRFRQVPSTGSGQAQDERQFAVLFDVRGRGTEWLSRRRAGDGIDLFGPLGRGYAVARQSQNLLLVAGGIGVAALVALADQAIAQGRAVTLLQGARTAAGLFPSRLLPPEVEVITATDDGSAGHRGLVTELIPQYLPWADGRRRAGAGEPEAGAGAAGGAHGLRHGRLLLLRRVHPPRRAAGVQGRAKI
jgi:dihydroorotate dehydrogenase electron transfer subunit